MKRKKYHGALYSCICGLCLGGSGNAASTSTPSAPASGNLAKFALVVGIDKYQHVKPQLSGCVNDAKDMSDVLTGPNYKFPKANVELLKEGEARYQDIEKAFQKLIQSATENPDAVVVFYFAGHGSQVKDTNSDEAEGDDLDETLVTFDSNPEGANTDITDDQLASWLKKLETHTKNVTVILDSCHSGSGTRAAGARFSPRQANVDLRNLPVQPSLDTLGIKRESLAGNDFQFDTDNYVALFSCFSNQRSYESRRMVDGKEKTYGAFTYFLLEQLREARQGTTWADVSRHVAGAVSGENSEQVPDLYGNGERLIFGGPAATGKISFPVKLDPAPKSNLISFEAGTVHGARDGGFIGVYGPGSDTLSGDKDLIARGQITKAGDLRSSARIDTASVPPGSRVTLLSPYFGTGPLQVRLVESGMNALPDQVANKLRTLLGQDGLLQIVSAGAAATAPAGSGQNSLTVLCAPFKDIPLPNDKILQFTASGGSINQVVCFAATPGGRPVFDRVFRPAADGSGAEADGVARVIAAFARQRNLSVLSNNMTIPALKNMLEITVELALGNEEPDPDKLGRMKFAAQQDKGKNAYQPLKLAKGYKIPARQRFRLRLKNKSREPIYVTVLDISPNGDINVIESINGAVTFGLPRFESVLTDRYVIVQDSGTETFKAIVTTKPMSFSSLQQKVSVDRQAVRDANLFDNPIQWLTGQAAGLSRSPKGAEKVVSEGWTTEQIEFVLTPQQTLTQ